MAYAFDALGDAWDATRAFLLPFDRGRWLRLALIAFFVFGSAGGFPGGAGNTGGSFDTTTDGASDVWDGGPVGEIDVGSLGNTLVSAVPLWVIVLLVVVVAVGVLYALIGAIMEFVLYESLRSERVSVREYGRRNLGQGLRLFAFRFLVGVLGIVFFLVVLAGLVYWFFTGPTSFIAGILVLIPLIFLLGILGGLVNLFTTEFVAPIMLAEQRGVLSGWRRFLGLFTAEWQEFVVYGVVRFGLNIVASLALGLFVGLFAFVLAIPFGTLGVLLWVGLSGASQLVTLAILGLVALVYGLLLFLVALFMSVPVVTYLRYYALLVLGDVDETLDLIPDRRAAIRSSETGSPGP